MTLIILVAAMLASLPIYLAVLVKLTDELN
jgi:hypothetical protein